MDIFSEIAILERFRGRPGMCQLLDYGLDGDDFIMVLRHYSGSLKAWRDQMPDCPDGQLRMYLQIFGDIVSGVQVSAHLPAGTALHDCHSLLHLPLSCTGFTALHAAHHNKLTPAIWGISKAVT